MNIIRCENLTKIFKSPAGQLTVLNKINLEVSDGSFAAIIGKSGSGKSSLLNILGGLDSKIEGEVSIQNKSLKNLKDSDLADFRSNTIGFVFQQFYLQPYLNVSQNVELPLIFQNISIAERKTRVEKVLKAVGLDDRVLYLPYQLSGGQMQRVAIARSIVTQPKIILADEPTGNLDVKTGEEIIDLLVKIQKEFGTTLVIVTHDPDIAKKAELVFELRDGKVVDKPVV